MAACNACQAPIAWKKVWQDGRNRWVKYEPERESDGSIKYVSMPNGPGKDGNKRFVKRAVPSAELHACKAPGQSPMPGQTPEPVPAPFVPFPAPQDEPQPEQQAPHAPEAPHAPHAPLPVALSQEQIAAAVRAEMKAILDEYGVERPAVEIVVRVGGRPEAKPLGKVVHPLVAEMLPYLANGLHVYLHGPAGSGKTYAARQALDGLGLSPVVITMPGITPAKLLGYARPDGTFVRTAFVDALENGHGVVLDELDRALPSVAACLNSILENRVYSEGDRTITAHPSFVVVGTGNTDFRGATRSYTSAQPLDMATAARFAFLSFGYDEDHETKLVRSVDGLSKAAADVVTRWTRKVRAILKRDEIDTVFAGPRESYRIAQALSMGVPFERAAHAWTWRGLDTASVERINREAGGYPDVPVKGGEDK